MKKYNCQACKYIENDEFTNSYIIFIHDGHNPNKKPRNAIEIYNDTNNQCRHLFIPKCSINVLRNHKFYPKSIELNLPKLKTIQNMNVIPIIKIDNNHISYNFDDIEFLNIIHNQFHFIFI